MTNLLLFINGAIAVWAYLWRIPRLERQLRVYRHREEGCKLPYGSDQPWTCPECGLTWKPRAESGAPTGVVWSSETRRIR